MQVLAIFPFLHSLEKLTDHLANILEQQKIEAVKPKEKSAEEIARKQAILDHYEQVSSGEEYPFFYTEQQNFGCI